MRRTLVLGSSLAVALVAAGCQDQTTAPALTPVQVGPTFRLQGAMPEGPRVERDAVTLPPAARLSDQQLADVARRAIDGDDYVCPASTPIVDWFLGAVTPAITQERDLFTLLYVNLAADQVATYETLLFETTATPQYFGYDGEYTRIMGKTERDVKRFWDIPSDDIQVVGLHGSALLDSARVAATYRAVFGVPSPLAEVFAGLVRGALLESQTLNGGDHPLFSFNSFAFTTHGGPIPDKIVMGDGVLDGFAALGFGDVAPQAIFAHEFAHQIQFENGYLADPYATTGDAAEATRYGELMSDAMSAYYLTHKRGGAMNRKRVAQFLEVFYQIGDCGFADAGHHGTPNQRMAAARFGFEVADQAQKQGHILTSEQFHALFVAEYPALVAPDAP